MATLPVTSFSVGDSVVGLPITSPAAVVTWVPDASGFDSMCRANGPVGHFLKSQTEYMLSLARSMVPVDTGELAESLDIEYGKWEGGIYGEVYTDVYYAVFQEYGTINHSAQPFLRPALEAAMGGWVDGSIDIPDSFQAEAGMIGDFNWNSGAREWIGNV